MRKLKKYAMLAIIFAIVLFGVYFIFSGSNQKAGGQYPDKILGLKIHTMIAPKGGANRPEIKREIKYIVIHETDNFAESANAKAHAKLQANGGENKTSWHYTVDENEGYHSIPDDEIAWHAGDGRDGDGNVHGIGLELCVNKNSDFEKTFDNAAKLAGYLMNAYNISAEGIRPHFDFSGKDCPHKILEANRLSEFRALASKYSSELKPNK